MTKELDKLSEGITFRFFNIKGKNIWLMIFISAKHDMNNITLWSFKMISALSIGKSHKTLITHPWKSLTYAIHQDFLIYLFTLWIRYMHLYESHTWLIHSWDMQSYDDESSIYLTLWVIRKINQHIQPRDCNWAS